MSQIDTELPADKHCRCGYRVKWYTIDPNPDATSIFYELAEEWGLPHLESHEDVVERDCPHHNGTVIQYCPNCNAQVDMWGCGPAGGIECECWDGDDQAQMSR